MRSNLIYELHETMLAGLNCRSWIFIIRMTQASFYSTKPLPKLIFFPMIKI